jgi:hypothetical protein
MIGALFGGTIASPWARTALRYGAVALAILLFLLSIDPQRRGAHGAGLSGLSQTSRSCSH